LKDKTFIPAYITNTHILAQSQGALGGSTLSLGHDSYKKESQQWETLFVFYLSGA